jgi:hypothetical protein
LHTNFELSNAKAIVLSPQEILTIPQNHVSIFAPVLNSDQSATNDQGWRDHLRMLEYKCPCRLCTSSKIGRPYPSIPVEFVLGLMCTCREARTVARKVYALYVVSTLPNDFLPWDPIDVLYFPQMHHALLLKGFMKQIWKTPNPFSESIHHIAVHITVDDTLLERTLLPFGVDRRRVNDELSSKLLKNLPNLHSIDGLLDPANVGMKTTGSLVLYESINKPISDCYDRTPSEVVQIITSELTRHATSYTPKREVPLFELSVLCWKKPKSKRS